VSAEVSEPKIVSKAALVAYASSENTDVPESKPVEANSKNAGTGETVAVTANLKHDLPAAQNTNGLSAPAAQVTNGMSMTYAAAAATSNASAKSFKANSSAPATSQGGVPMARGSYIGKNILSRGTSNQSKWPKKIPNGDPKRWEIDWFPEEEQEDCCSIDSLRADSGYGGEDKKKKRVVVAGVDPDTGFQLTDFSGNWAPAPIDWDSRPGFRPDMSVQKIEEWMCTIETEMKGETWLISHKDVSLSDGLKYYFAPSPDDPKLLLQGEIAPRYWGPQVVGTDSPNLFWKKLTSSQTPKPVHEGDIDVAKPWWCRYASNETCFLTPREHPEVKRVDPDEKEQERVARENDYGSLHHAENRKRVERAKRDAQRERRIRANEKARKLSEAQPSGTPREAIKPGVNLYLRSACANDMQRIKEIYNHYVEHSVCVPETQRLGQDDMIARYHDIVSKKLPFLVACERGGKITARRKNREDIILPDKIVGFAHANDHHDMKGM